MLCGAPVSTASSSMSYLSLRRGFIFVFVELLYIRHVVFLSFEVHVVRIVILIGSLS